MAQRKDWLALVAVHSDAWLMAVAFYYGAKFDGKERCGKRRLPPSASTDFRVFISALLAHNSSPLGPPSLSADRRRPPFRRRREKLFKHINSLPTVYEILSGKAVNKPKAKAKGAAAGQVSAIPTTAFLPNFPHCHALRSFSAEAPATLDARPRRECDLRRDLAAASMSTNQVSDPIPSRSRLENLGRSSPDRRLRPPDLRCANAANALKNPPKIHTRSPR